MKRIEAIVKSDKQSAVVNALDNAGIGGLTVSKSQGRGAGKRPEVGGSRGTSSYVAEYNNSATILTIVDDVKVDTVIEAIKSAASTGKRGDGKIFVSTVDDAYDIATNQKGLN